MYEARRDSLMTPERVSVRHILLRTDGASKEAAAKKLAEAQALIKQLRAGANFEELAKKVSEDPGSKDKGGNLGFVMRGQMVKNFEDAAFSLPPKQISEVISTEYGYHVLEVLDKQAARVPSFEESAMSLRQEVQREMAFPRMQKIMDEVRKELVKNPGSAENLARSTGIQAIKIDKVQPLGNYGGLGQMPELDNLLPAMKLQEVSPVINIEGGTQVVAILSGINPQRPSTFEEMAGQASQTAKATKVATLFKQKAEILAQKAKEYSGDLKRAAKELGFTTKEAPEVNRDGAFEGLGSAGAMPELFTRPVGSVVGPVLRDEEYVVAKVTKRIEPDLSQLPAQRAQLLTKVREKKIVARGSIFEDGLVVELLREGKIKIYENGVQRVVSSF
jgi:peptidyl-prolyl cis-trans isomerase D